MHKIRVGAALTAACIGGSVVAMAVPAGAAPAATGQVTVVHGVRGLLADVWVDGKQVLSSFSPERVTDPLTLPAGTHQVAVRPHGASATSKPAAAGSVDVPANGHMTIAAGLRSSGTPMLQAYNDDHLAGLVRGAGHNSGLVIRDVAAAPSVRVSVDGHALPAIVSPNQAVASGTSGSHTLSVSSEGGDSAALPPDSVPTQIGSVTVVYLIGSAKDSSLGWLAQTVKPASSPMAAPPARVETGNSGLAATNSDRIPLTAGIGAGLLILAMAWGLLRPRTVRVGAHAR